MNKKVSKNLALNRLVESKDSQKLYMAWEYEVHFFLNKKGMQSQKSRVVCWFIDYALISIVTVNTWNDTTKRVVGSSIKVFKTSRYLV